MGILGGLFGGDDTQTVENNPWGPSQTYLKGGTIGGYRKPIYGGGGGPSSQAPAHVRSGLGLGSGPGQQIVGYENIAGQEIPGVLPEAADLYGQTQGMDPYQSLGQQYLAEYAQGPELSGLFGNAQQGVNFFASGDVLSPDSNPYLRENVDAYANAVNDALQRTTLSNIDDSMVAGGQGWNSSQAGIERGLARGEASEAVADYASRMYGDAYNRGLSAMQRGIGMAPSIGQFGQMPAQSLMAAGDYGESSQWSPLMNYSNIINQVAGQGGQQVSPQSSGGLLGALGGASAGAGLASTLELSTPWGAGLGALAGLLS